MDHGRKAIKLIGENIGSKLLDIDLGNDFFESYTQGKTKQLGLHQKQKLLHSKGNHQQIKRQPTEWEKIFVKHIPDKGVIFTIYKELIQLNSKKNKSLQMVTAAMKLKYADSLEGKF